MTATAAELSSLIRGFFAPNPPGGLGVAVSGGGDSIALLHLLADWQDQGGPTVRAVTVDHGLRPEAAAEAAAVAQICARRGVSHDTLQWQGWDGRGNLPDQARRARYRLMAEWAGKNGIDTIAVGHTADDLAETFLMRLARGSGVDGLAAMDARRLSRGVHWLRPLLTVRRGTLREWLRARDLGWSEDPTNDDPAYDRVRVRQALAILDPLGITVEGLVATATRLRSASEALRSAALGLARAAVKIEAGDVVIDRAMLEAAPVETRNRLLSQALIWVASADYRPRYQTLQAIWAAVAEGRRATLMGCMILPSKRVVRVVRELAAVAQTVGRPGEKWDGRWIVTGGRDRGYQLRALGEKGLMQCADWRSAGLPRASLLATPALWDGARLVAAPLAGFANGWTAKLAQDGDDFFSSVILH